MIAAGPRASLALGLLLLAAAAWCAPSPDAAASAGAADGQAVALAEPLAAALAPLGPLKAVVSSVLWVRLVRSQMDGDAAAIAMLSEGLLALHPGLEGVRRHLASELIVSRATRAPDAARHRALVHRGLAMLEDGLVLQDSPRLHGTLGRLVALQSRHDPRFETAARQFFGGDPGDVAIDELRLAGDVDGSAAFLADLLVDRGILSWSRDRDVAAADRDLAEAERLTRGMPGVEADDVADRIAEIRRSLLQGEPP